MSEVEQLWALMDTTENSTIAWRQGKRSYADHVTCRATAVDLFLKRKDGCTEDEPMAPEPVAVEDITPGWYFTDCRHRISYVNVQPSGGMIGQPLSVFYQNSRVPLLESSPNITFYHAPSPESLMGMCLGWHSTPQPTVEEPAEEHAARMTASRQPQRDAFEVWMKDFDPTLTTYGGSQLWHRVAMLATFEEGWEQGQAADLRTPGRGATQTERELNSLYDSIKASEKEAARLLSKDRIPPAVESHWQVFDGEKWQNTPLTSGIPPAVEVALRVCEQDGRHGGMPPWTSAQAIVRDYLDRHSPKENLANIKTCGECKNYSHDKNIAGWGQCMARGGHFETQERSSFALRCKFATPNQ